MGSAELKGYIKRGRPEKQYNETHAKIVKALATYNVCQKSIAREIGTDDAVMMRLYEKEYREGKSLAESKIKQTAFKIAVEDKNPAMLMFILKTQYGYRETQQLDMVSSDKSMSPTQPDLSHLSYKELSDLVKMRVEQNKQDKQNA